MRQPTLRRSTWARNTPKMYEYYIPSIALIYNGGEPCYQGKPWKVINGK